MSKIKVTAAAAGSPTPLTPPSISPPPLQTPPNQKQISQTLTSFISHRAFSATAAIEAAFNLAHSSNPPPQCVANCSISGGSVNKTRCCAFSDQEIADCTLGGADTCNALIFLPLFPPFPPRADMFSSCDVGGEPHDALLWLAGHDGATLNTEKQYPYVSGETGKLTKCSPKLDGVATGERAQSRADIFHF